MPNDEIYAAGLPLGKLTLPAQGADETAQAASALLQARKQFIGDIPQIPVCEAVEGIRYDFNYGLRIRFPEEGGPWHVIFRDLDTRCVLFRQDAYANTSVSSVKRYYVRFAFEIYRKSDLDSLAGKMASDPYFSLSAENSPDPVFRHEFDAKDKTVLVKMAVPTLGDTFAWFPYVETFRQKHGCKMVAVLQPQFIEILKKQYPQIRFITEDQISKERPYACYRLGLFFGGDTEHQPCDFRLVGLHRTAAYILGVDPVETPPRFDLSAKRKIAERYVCIAVQSTSQPKYWNNPQGWHDVVGFLRENGYRVLCMDRDRVHGQGLVWNHIPNGCEDWTGNLPLQERIDIIKDADFFIGVSSGLSWLAWGCKVPVVMISGFSHPTNEFFTPYRVINYHACNSCWNDMRHEFDHYDYFWCPRHKGTPRQFECSITIESEQVIETIRRIPAFQEQARIFSKQGTK